MKQDTKEKMDFWLSQNPESTHPWMRDVNLVSY